MRFIIMHKTSARWEAGAIPSREMIARVGAMLGGLAKQHVLLAGEGLRPSSEGLRLTFRSGTPTITAGPFTPANELPAGFSILRVESLDEAVDWATREARVLGDIEVDIRPVTEAWDIGMMPKPANVTTTRYMVLRKATPASEAGVALSPPQQTGLASLIDETTRTGVHLATETMKPSARGRRYKHAQGGLQVTDGPFTETKELIAGYVIVAADSLDAADRWAREYIAVVEAGEVDVRELEAAR